VRGSNTRKTKEVKGDPERGFAQVVRDKGREWGWKKEEGSVVLEHRGEGK